MYESLRPDGCTWDDVCHDDQTNGTDKVGVGWGGWGWWGEDGLETSDILA